MGLLESKEYPWMAASPDGIGVVTMNGNNLIVISIEIKTRVAEEIAAEVQ